MPDTPAEQFSSIAVLAENDPDWEDGPFAVRGVALPEDITTSGNANNQTVHWPSRVVESAADEFDGAKITDPSEHDPQTAVENPQPSPDTIIGEITNATYEPGTGVIYEGEIDDPEIAKRVERGRVEVSPTIFRTVGDTDDDGSAPVQDIKAVRDLSVVAEGQADGNRIEPATAAIASLSAEALSAMFDADAAAESMATHKEVAGVRFRGTRTGSLDESKIDKDETDLSDHYLYGSGDDKEDFSYPVVDAEGFLRRGNVDSAWELGCRGQCPSEETHDERLLKLAQEFDNPPEWAESNSVAAGSQNDDGPDGSTALSSAAETTTTTMSENELSEDEQAVLAAADNLDEPAEVLAEYAAAEQPTIVEQDEIETMRARLDDFEAVVNDRLAETTGLSQSTVETMSLEAKVAEFQTDEGDLDAEALVQTPETGTPEGDFDGEADAEVLADLPFEADDRDEAVETLRERYEKFEAQGWNRQAEQAAERLEQLGVEVDA